MTQVTILEKIYRKFIVDFSTSMESYGSLDFLNVVWGQGDSRVEYQNLLYRAEVDDRYIFCYWDLRHGRFGNARPWLQLGIRYKYILASIQGPYLIECMHRIVHIKLLVTLSRVRASIYKHFPVNIKYLHETPNLLTRNSYRTSLRYLILYSLDVYTR